VTNVLNNYSAARAYGCLRTSFRRLERDIRRRGALSLVSGFKFVLTFFSHMDNSDPVGQSPIGNLMKPNVP
jgi:hypothetical protein